LTDRASGRKAEYACKTQEGSVTDRRRTCTWADPAELATAAGDRDGLRFLLDISAGLLPPPPIMETLAVGAIEAERGRVVFTLDPAEWHYNPLGSVHGGVLATMLDSAAGCAVHSTLPAGVGYTSLDLVVRFLRPVSVRSGRLRCEGVVLSAGSRTALAEARLVDAAGRLLAHATSTCMLLRPDAAPPANGAGPARP
jgi:uncharacterized protein (TIGR00369 family)